LSTRQDYITAIGSLVQGDYPPGESAKVLAIGQAVKTYSKHVPQLIVEDETGADAFDYALTLFTDWSDGFSTIKSVEYPVDDTNETPEILQDDEWTIYEKPTGKCLRFLRGAPVTTKKFRVIYTALHICTDAACTVKTIDEEAVQSLAAAYYCEMLAAYFAQSQGDVIKADVVDHMSKSASFAARARAYKKIYLDHVGVEEGKAPAASVTRDQDTAGSFGDDRMTHGKRWR